MLDIKKTRRINKPIDEVWRFVIDEFAEGHRWAFGTSSCRPGTADEPFDRVCHTETGVLKGTITKVDDENYVLEFSVEGLPFFVRSVVATWSLVAVGGDATDITIGPRIDTMPVRWGKMYDPEALTPQAVLALLEQDMADRMPDASDDRLLAAAKDDLQMG